MTNISSTTFGKSPKSIIKSVRNGNPTKNITGKEAAATLKSLGYEKIAHTGSPALYVNACGDCLSIPTQKTLGKETRLDFIKTILSHLE